MSDVPTPEEMAEGMAALSVRTNAPEIVEMVYAAVLKAEPDADRWAIAELAIEAARRFATVQS